MIMDGPHSMLQVGVTSLSGFPDKYLVFSQCWPRGGSARAGWGGSRR